MLSSCTRHTYTVLYKCSVCLHSVLRGSAIEITWNHWATLVKDLEEVAEKHRQDAAATGTPPAAAVEDDKDVSHWERRPTWQRTAFCGVYALGWAFSTAYLLKYTQTYVTKLKFFRAPLPPLSATSSSATTSSIAAPIKQKIKPKRMIHISTASNTAGITIPLTELTIQDGRNETELVIRAKDIADEKGKVIKRKRDYWFVSLTDAVVGGAKSSSHESARDQVLFAWDGIGGAERKPNVLSGFRSGPVVKD